MLNDILYLLLQLFGFVST